VLAYADYSGKEAIKQVSVLSLWCMNC